MLNNKCCICIDGICRIEAMFTAYGDVAHKWELTESNYPSATIRSRPWSVLVFHNAREIAVQVSFEDPNLKPVSSKYIDINFANPKSMSYEYLVETIRMLQAECLDPMELEL